MRSESVHRMTAPVLAALVLLPSTVAAGPPSSPAEQRAAANQAPQVDVCWGYGCRQRASARLAAPDWQAIRAELEPPAPTAAAERDSVARAIARFERAVGPLTGTSGNLGESNFNGIDEPGQMDCIDEAHNTSGYLRLLADHGLLYWHEPAGQERRAPWFFNTHWSAVMIERDSGERWVVDSWFLDNGSRPYIQSLGDWKRGRALPPNPDAAAERGA